MIGAKTKTKGNQIWTIKKYFVNPIRMFKKNLAKK